MGRRDGAAPSPILVGDKAASHDDGDAPKSNNKPQWGVPDDLVVSPMLVSVRPARKRFYSSGLPEFSSSKQQHGLPAFDDMASASSPRRRLLTNKAKHQAISKGNFVEALSPAAGTKACP